MERPVGSGLNIVDLLCTTPSSVSFPDRIRRLQLSETLERTILGCHGDSVRFGQPAVGNFRRLSSADEEELATEVLRCRYRFTQCVLKNETFRQTALTVIQNIYLFRDRHIFFRPSESSEEERQQALELFSTRGGHYGLSIDQTLQHPVLARVWARIVGRGEVFRFSDPAFLGLHAIIEKLNTLRNIYMLFFSAFVRKIAAKVSPVYRQSIAFEDAIQIGSFGIARAAYRYHPSCGLRFSTYAVNWIFKELQRQALEGRLVRISANVVEHYSRACRNSGEDKPVPDTAVITDAVPVADEQWTVCREEEHTAMKASPENLVEERQRQHLALRDLETKLSPRSADILKRRFGLAPYNGVSQSIVSIAGVYGLTRGRVYQLEQEALNRLRRSIHVL